jgi:hypothetical protein
MSNGALSNFVSGSPGLLEAIQEVAHKEGRMANQMAERAIATLRELAEGHEVSEEDLAHTIQLLEFVSEGTLIYVQQIQESHPGI